MNARKALPFVVYAFLVALPGGCGGDDDSNDGSGGSAGRQGGAAGKATGGAGTAGAKAAGGAGGTSKGGATGSGGAATQGGSLNHGGSTAAGEAGLGGLGEGGSGFGGSGFGGGSSGGNSSGGTSGGSVGNGGSGHGGTTEISGGAGGGGGDFSGGAGGASGAGGSGGDPNAVAETCAEICNVDSDCFKSVGVSNGRICSPTTHRCVVHTCDGDTECVPVGTAWTVPCSDDGGCSSTQTCIDLKGAGRCAALPDNGTCTTGMETVSWKHFGDANNVTICADTSYKCKVNNCVKPCTSTSCTAPGSACNSVTGLCDLCTSDQACGGSTKPPHCNVNTGRCECVLNSDCAAVINTNVCVNGRCGCSSDTTCVRKTGNNSTLICE